MEKKQQKKAVLSLSGGMDSSSLLVKLLAEGYEVKALCFDYGQKHNIEVDRAKSLWRYLSRVGPIKNYEDFHLIKFPLQDLLHSALVKGGEDVPEGHYESENMKATVVPNRNKIFSSIIQAAALSWAIESGDDVVVAMGIHSGDHAIYPDCRKSFRDLDYEAFLEGNWDAEKVTLYTPYLELDKFEILEESLENCKKIGVEFDKVYKRTITSYKPLFHTNDVHQMLAYSDYKSASSVERVEAFMKLGRPDPISYANLDGPVSWDHVVYEVSKILQK